jgi:hypothetical protein
LADFKSIACCFHPRILILHLNQVIEDKMKEGEFTITNEAYFMKNYFVPLVAIFELQKLKAENMHLNRSKSLATAVCYNQEELSDCYYFYHS